VLVLIGQLKNRPIGPPKLFWKVQLWRKDNMLKSVTINFRAVIQIWAGNLVFGAVVHSVFGVDNSYFSLVAGSTLMLSADRGHVRPNFFCWTDKQK